jgi:hypothetical protein
MYFWDIKSLKRDLSEGQLSEPESFKYLMGLLVGSSISSMPKSTPTPIEPLAMILLFLGPLIVIGGIYYSYVKNGGAKGQFFVHRLLSIMWVTSIRWGVLIFIPFLVAYIVLLTLKIIPSNQVYLVVGIYIISGLLYWRIGKHIHEIATHVVGSEPPTTTEAGNFSKVHETSSCHLDFDIK